MSIQQKLIITGLLYLLTIAGGIWTSLKGRPLNALLNTVHKLLAVGAAVFTGILLFGGFGFGALSPFSQAAGIAVISVMVALFASGVMLSGKEKKKGFVRVHIAGTVMIALCLISFLFSLSDSEILPAGMR